MRIARNLNTVAARGGPALFQLVRFWSRRWLRDDHPDAEDHALDILVLEAADAALRHGRTASVAEVAAQLGIDRSGASRLIASAQEQGYLVRETAVADARRAEVRLTRPGRVLLNAARRWQSATFLALMADWDAQDVERFAAYLVRLADTAVARPEQDNPE